MRRLPLFALASLLFAIPSEVLAGACCTATGCSDVTEAVCITLGGHFAGVSTVCSDLPPPCASACCSGAGCFNSNDEAECASLGGNYAGLGTRCTDVPHPCASGACCTPTGCLDAEKADCDTLAGLYAGDGTDCFDSPPPCAGSCCTGASCATTDDEAQCGFLGGSFRGVGVPCVPDPCAGPGISNVYESTNPATIVLPANLVGTATATPYDHPPATGSRLYYQFFDPIAVIRLTKGGLGVLIWY